MKKVLKLKKYDSDIKLIVGLGNTGEKYASTRHNAGYLFTDYFMYVYLNQFLVSPQLTEKKSYRLYTFDELDLALLKPSLMMNLSGEALLEYIKYKDYSLDEILVVHDDLDISIGNHKLQISKSPVLHNGISSIESVLAGKDFYRLRLGIENRTEYRIPGIKYVLEKFSEEEKEQLQVSFQEICQKEFNLV